MNTNEAIEFMKEEKRIECGHATQCKLAKKFNQIIILLQQGENDRIELADENQMLKNEIKDLSEPVSYTHLTLPTTPYV